MPDSFLGGKALLFYPDLQRESLNGKKKKKREKWVFQRLGKTS